MALTTVEPPPVGEVDAIQPGGFAVLVDRDWSIVRASANLDQFFAVDPARCIGAPLADVMTADAVHSLRNRMTLMRRPGDHTRLFACRASGGETRFDFVVRAITPAILIEGRLSGRAEHGDSAEMVRALIAQLDAGANDGPGVLAEAARQLRAMTGYDRVACYAFARGGPPSLVAQSAREMGPAPGELPDWFHGTTKLVLDGDPVSVPLLPQKRDGIGGEALFGALTPVQHRWLNERGAAAAMALGVRLGLHDWGAIVCDHPVARRIPFDRQASFELYVDMLAMKLEIAELRRR